MNGRTDHLAEMPTASPNLTIILGVTFTLTAAMITVVVARLVIRIRGGMRSVRLADWVHLLACLLSVAVSVTTMIAVWYWVGYRRFGGTASDTVNLLKYYWISKILYVAATWVVKMAVFATLLLANAPPQQGRKFFGALLYGAMVSTTACTVVFWIGVVIECRPMRGIFDRQGIRDVQCFSPDLVRRMANGRVTANAATDLFFVLLSIPIIVYGARRSMREKVALGVVFMLAFFAVGAAIVHMLYEFGYIKTGNIMHDKNDIAIWAIVEINIGLIAANLSALSPLLRSFLQPRRSPSRPHSHSHSHSPASPTPSTLLAMTAVQKEHLGLSESQQTIVNVRPSSPPPTSLAPPFAQSTQRFSSASKSSFNEIMAVQVNVDIKNHPAFREKGGIVPRTGVGRGEISAPLMF